MATNLTSSKLIEVFNAQMVLNDSYKHIGELSNPCNVMFKGKEYYIYVKNISSAYFSNPDISRAQLTSIDALYKIKDSSATFIMLGYDEENKVYAVWNPFMVKQRIGTAVSPSFYSRFSWQKAAAEANNFILKELKHEGKVLLFPQHMIVAFMSDIKKFFPDTSRYVAMGSKKRTGANAVYKKLLNTKHLKNEFAEYLCVNLGDTKLVTRYTYAVRQLIQRTLISSNRKIFLSCDSIEEYRDASDKFLALDSIKKLDSNTGGIFTRAFKLYVEFLIYSYGEAALKTNDESQHQEDYETPYIDDNGILTRIANPRLIKLLKPDLDNEYPRPIAAYATIEDFYGDRFPNMEMKHWQKLFKQINWDNPYTNVNDTQTKDMGTKRTKSKKIQVTFPDGNVLCNDKAIDTFLSVIEYAGIENVKQLNIRMGKRTGNPLICDSANPKYPMSFKKISEKTYVNACSSTETKANQILQISEKLNLGLKVCLV